ncbi:hypothetical protein ACVIHH_008241 [Bradyrhizobium sp. USDA 4518]
MMHHKISTIGASNQADLLGRAGAIRRLVIACQGQCESQGECASDAISNLPTVPPI